MLVIQERGTGQMGEVLDVYHTGERQWRSPRKLDWRMSFEENPLAQPVWGNCLTSGS